MLSMSCACVLRLLLYSLSVLPDSCLQAVEVAAPNATYELVVKTALGKGSTIPKGRYNLPRETKKATGDKILVFAEGRVAEEAKQAGADVVGGPELADAVSMYCQLPFAPSHLPDRL